LTVAVVAGAVMVLVGTLVAPARGQTSSASEHFGALEFPRDENLHPDGRDYWWGAAELVTTAGNHYTLGLAFDAANGYAADGHELYPHTGPYSGETVATEEGGTNWGHPDQPAGRFVSTASAYVPGVRELLNYKTVDTQEGGKTVAQWQRTSLADHTYHLLIDDDAARVHPTGQLVRLGVDLQSHMRKPPLLAGGTGRWWYEVPETFGYPSRSFQYMQAADELTGTLQLGQPDGSVAHETVDPTKSTLEMVHEYDAGPEDIPVGLGLTLLSQLNERYAQYYQGGLTWELLFADLRNGAQLMVAVLAYHDTDSATLHPVIGKNMPRYIVSTTLRLPTGESVSLGNDSRVEHLDYRTLIGQVPTFDVSIDGIWKEAWGYRVSYPGGTVAGPKGPVAVPAFDLGFNPEWAKNQPTQDAAGNGQTQRIPFAVGGNYAGCPVNGFAWSELIVNWYGHEGDDPWYTGGSLPPTPAGCGVPSGTGSGISSGGGGSGGTPPGVFVPSVQPDTGCGAYNPGAPTCTYVAKTNAGIAGYGSAPGGWTVTITRPGLTGPLVVKSLGGSQTYQCGTIRTGDSVWVSTEPGSFVSIGNPGFCF
jgi:hypothetical protein